MVRLGGLAALASAFPIALAAAPVPGDDGTCRVTLRVEPRTPFVEQAVHWDLEVARRGEIDRLEWIEAPRFPGARAERVVTRSPGGDDAGWHIRRDERVFFPERAGPLVLPEARVACATGDGWHEAGIPEQRLEVRPLPVEGRPEGFGGLVGAVTLRRYLLPEEVRVGETARLIVSLRGTGNVWALADPLRELQLPDTDVFPQPAQDGIERGGRLRTTRVFEAALVPRRPGALELPALRVDWLEPATGRYASASLPPVVLPVGTRRPAPPAEPSRAAAPDDPPGRGAVRGSLPAAGLWVAVRAALVLGGIGVLAWGLRRRARPRAVGGPGRGVAPERAADGAARAERALREALARAQPDGVDLTPDQWLARDDLDPDQRAVAELLRRAERARFDRGVEPPPEAEVAERLAALARRGRR